MSKPLNAITKRDLLASEKAAPEVVRAYAEEFLQRGRLGDAFAFFRKLRDAEDVGRVKEAAKQDGEPEVLWSIERRFAEVMDRADWIECGERAMEMGKYRCAAYAFAHVREEERRAEAERHFKPAEEAPPDPRSPDPE